MKKIGMRVLAFWICVLLLPTELFWSAAAERGSEPPRYMRELSRLVAATASEDDFGEIKLTLGESEMEVDGEKQEISEDGYAVPFVDEDGVLQIPEEAVVGAEAPDESGLLTEEELEAQGYEVQTDYESGTVTITEPYGLCRIVVRTKDGTVQNTYGATDVLRISDNMTILQYATKERTAEAAEQYAKQEDVLFCEPDSICTVSAASEDTDYICWGTEVSGADQFMATLPDTKDLPQVTVAVIDTGVDMEHPFLEGRILDNGWDFVSDDDDPDDDHFHGTHCTGIVRDATPGNVKILPVKVIDSSGNGDGFVIAEGIRFAADAGADILSLSLGGTGLEETLGLAIAYAKAQGCTVFASAGNDGMDLARFPTYPACCDGVIAVAASDDSDHRAAYSNFGSRIVLTAPGSNIKSSVPGGAFRVLSGTSMACPLVAACAALVKTEDPSRNAEDLRTYLSKTARDVYTPGKDDQSGFGIVYLGAYRRTESIHLPYANVTLEPIEWTQLTVDFVPSHPSDRTLSFSSSNPQVASVSDTGLITALSAGTAQITAQNAASGVTCSVTVTVLEGDGCCRVKQIWATGNGKILVQKDGSAYIHGRSHFGYYKASSTALPFRFCGASKEPITDIDRFIAPNAFLKTDGTLWICGLFPWSQQRSNKIPEMAVKPDNTPLRGVVSFIRNMVLCEDGTLWQCKPYHEPVFTPVTDEYGAPITHVRWLGNGCAVTEDGRMYENSNMLFVTNFDEITMHLVYNKDGTLLQGVRQAYSCIINTGSVRQLKYSVKYRYVLFEDGTLMNHLTQTTVTSNVAELILGVELYALKTDGTVWTAKGEQILKENGMPLDHVTHLATGNSSVWALCSDGTVWAWGHNYTTGLYFFIGDDTTQLVTRHFGWLGIGWRDAQLFNGGALQSLSEDGFSYVDLNYSTLDDDAYVNVLPQTQQAAAQVMVDENTPLTAVKDLIPTDGMMYVREDGSIYCSGTMEYLEYGAMLYRTSVYARPYTILGKQVYKDQTDDAEPARYGVQKITLSKQNMAATVGETFSLTASLYPTDTFERNIYWKSSAPSIASVQGDGTVTANAAGVAAIYAYSKANNKVWGKCIVTVEENTPKVVSVKQYPVRREYTPGDTLDTSGGMLTLQYENGVVQTISVSADFCSEYDLSQPGKQTVRIDFDRFSFTYPISVTEQDHLDEDIVSVGWVSLPQKRSYLVGEDNLALEDGVFVAVHRDGSCENIPLSKAMCSGFDLNRIGEQTVQVQYKQFTLSYTIIVAALPIEDVLQINAMENEIAAVFRWGSEFVPGVTLRVRYVDGTEGNMPVTAEMCVGQDMRKLGEQEVFVHFMEKSFSYNIRVVPDPEKIETVFVQTPPLVTHYNKVSSIKDIDVTGGELGVCFSDGTVQIIPMTDAMLMKKSKYIFDSDNALEIGLMFANRQTSFEVYHWQSTKDFVHAVMLREPTQQLYAVGEQVNPVGGIVQAMYADGKTIVFRTDDLDTSTVYEQSGEFETEIRLNDDVLLCYWVTVVEEKEPLPEDTSGDPPYLISWVSVPDTIVYCIGELLCVSGGAFLDGRGTTVSLSENMCSGFDPMQPGWQTVTVTYTGSTVIFAKAKTGTGTLTFDVFVTELVLENEVPEIEVGQCTRVLATFQPVDVDGREILWTSSNPDIATVDVYGRVTGIAPGTVEITAQVKGSEAVASCTVSVKERQSVYMPGDADGDGEVDLVDVAMIRRYLAGGWNAVIDLQNADVNGDGSVDLRDCVTLERYLAGGWNISL